MREYISESRSSEILNKIQLVYINNNYKDSVKEKIISFERELISIKSIQNKNNNFITIKIIHKII